MYQWLNNQNRIGEGIIVEIDEAKKFGRKFHRGRLVTEWLFGGIARNTKKMFIVSIKDRDAQTLLSFIRKNITPESIIHTDCWKAYSKIDPMYQHKTVNHSQNFVDPDTRRSYSKY